MCYFLNSAVWGATEHALHEAQVCHSNIIHQMICHSSENRPLSRSTCYYYVYTCIDADTGGLQARYMITMFILPFGSQTPGSPPLPCPLLCCTIPMNAPRSAAASIGLGGGDAAGAGQLMRTLTGRLPLLMGCASSPGRSMCRP